MSESIVEKSYWAIYMVSYSQTQWWSQWEIMNQVLVQFGDIEPFLVEHSDVSPATQSKLLKIHRN